MVIGLATKQKAGTDLIHAATPTPHDPNIRRKYVQVLQKRIYPLPDRLRIEVISCCAGDYTLIETPPQPDELRPFLVHGAVIGGRVNNTFLSIIERHDDEGIAASIASIHSTLVTGRALVRAPGVCEHKSTDLTPYRSFLIRGGAPEHGDDARARNKPCTASPERWSVPTCRCRCIVLQHQNHPREKVRGRGDV